MNVLGRPKTKRDLNDPVRRMARALALANVAAYCGGHRLPPLGHEPGWMALALSLVQLGATPPEATRLDSGVPSNPSAWVAVDLWGTFAAAIRQQHGV